MKGRGECGTFTRVISDTFPERRKGAIFSQVQQTNYNILLK